MEIEKTALENVGVNIAGVRMRTPIAFGAVGGVLSKRERATPERYSEVYLKHIAAGAGFMMLRCPCHVPPSLLADLEKKAKPAKFVTTKRTNIAINADHGSLSLYFVGGQPTSPAGVAGPFPEQYARVIEILRKKKPKDVPLIANYGGLGFFPETFVITAKTLEQAGVDLIELNFGSPGALYLEESIDGYFEKNFPLCNPGLCLGDQPDLVEMITREVVKAVSIPIGVKVSPETGFPRIIDLAKRIKNAGAKFITCSNFGIGIAPPDIYNKGKGRWRHIDGNPFAAVGGDHLRVSVYKQVAAVAKYVPGIDIIACGGLMSPEHIVEVMMLGAKGAQVVTPVLYRGRGMITRAVRFLGRYMKEQGYHSVEEFRGLGVQYIKAPNELPFQEKLFAEVDPAKCTGCGICADSICLALHMEDGVARVDLEDCSGCGVCVAICPKEAMSLKA